MRETLHPFDLAPSMSPTDALFWYTEGAVPAFRPVIAALCVLDRRPRADGLSQAIETTLRLVPRLRQRVVESAWHFGLPHYVDDPHFDLRYHVRHVSVPRPGSFRNLLNLASALLATPLDRERPLWEAYRIDGLENQRSAFLFKMHHSLVDGVGALAIARGLLQRSRGATPPHVVARSEPYAGAADEKNLLGTVIDFGWTRASAVTQATLAAGRALVSPVETWNAAWSAARSIRGLAADASQDAILDPIAEGAAGISRRLDVIDVSLERLRRMKTRLGGTVNDVVLTALAGAVGVYHGERGVPVSRLHCLVPTSLRGEEERHSFGNRFGLINVTLPVGEPRVRRRFAQIVQQTRRAKRDGRGSLYPLLLRSMPLLPSTAISWVAHQAFGRVNLVCTNIPGISEELYLSGAKVTAIYPFASPVEGTPLIVALVSYAGRVDIGIDTDPEAIPDPERLSTLFVEALDEIDRTELSAEEYGGIRRGRGDCREPPLHPPRRHPMHR